MGCSYSPPGTLYLLDLPQAAREPVCLCPAHLLLLICSMPVATADRNRQCQRRMPVPSCMLCLQQFCLSPVNTMLSLRLYRPCCS